MGWDPSVFLFWLPSWFSERQEPLMYTEHWAQCLANTCCLRTGGHHLYQYCDCCYALQHNWYPSSLTFSAGHVYVEQRAHWQIHRILQWVIRYWMVMFSCHRLCQRLSSPGPTGLVMQSTCRLLAYKTTTQKLFTQIIDARPAVKKFIYQAELHRLL